VQYRSISWSSVKRGVNLVAIRRLTSDLMSRSRLAVRSPFLKNFSDFVSLQCYGVQVLLFDDETDGQTDEA